MYSKFIPVYVGRWETHFSMKADPFSNVADSCMHKKGYKDYLNVNDIGFGLERDSKVTGQDPCIVPGIINAWLWYGNAKGNKPGIYK